MKSGDQSKQGKKKEETITPPSNQEVINLVEMFVWSPNWRNESNDKQANE